MAVIYVMFWCLLVLGFVWIGCCSPASLCSRANSCWAAAYECGFPTRGPSFDSFGFTYFSLLVFFVVFDLEVSLLLNMPTQLPAVGGFVYYIIFLLVLSVGFLLECALGYIHWGYCGVDLLLLITGSP